MQYLGIDWGTRRAAWCAFDQQGTLREGMVAADEDGLSRLALALAGDEVCGCIDARVLADLARRDLVPELWIPSVEERANRERIRRRTHLVRMRTSARNRIFGLLTQWGLRRSLKTLREPDALEKLAACGVRRYGVNRSPRCSR